MEFREKIIEYRSQASSVSSLSTKTDMFFLEKYGNRGKGGLVKFNGTLIPGSIYFFNYNTDSKIGEKIKFIDRNPLVLYLSSEKVGEDTIAKCLDLITVPPDQRVEILQRFWNKFSPVMEENTKKSSKGENPSPIRLSSDDLSSLFKGTGYKFSLGGFKVKFISEVKFIEPEDWHKIPYIKYSSVQGMPINEIYTNYKSKLKTE